MDVSLLYPSLNKLDYSTKYNYTQKSIIRAVHEFEYSHGYSPEVIFMSNSLYSFLVSQSRAERDYVMEHIQGKDRFCGMRVITYHSDDFEYYLAGKCGEFWDFESMFKQETIYVNKDIGTDF